MALEDFRNDMETCCRCSICKFIPLEKVEGYSNVNVCPSITRYNFHAYSGGGRLGIGVGMLEKKIDITDKLLEVVYNCQMCGACDVSCKYAMDMEVLTPINAIRAECVKSGRTLPALDRMVSSLKKGGPMILSANTSRGDWLQGLSIKDYTREKTQVAYHAGCRTTYDRGMWSVAQNSIMLMHKAGIDVGVAFDEACCGGRAYEMGYQEEATAQAKRNMEIFKKAGVKTLVTGCAECYFAFKVLYDRLGVKGDLEVLHTSEYFNRLIQNGQLKPNKKINLNITYHDPCHLGRQGEPHVNWNGKRIPGQMILFDPPKEFRRGSKGVYNPPRELLQSIPGLKLIDMPRTREYAWCCGAGGGVRETNPNFAQWTAAERIKEAASTEAQAIVTGCPGCESLFNVAVKASNTGLQILDVVDLLAKSVL